MLSFRYYLQSTKILKLTADAAGVIVSSSEVTKMSGVFIWFNWLIEGDGLGDWKPIGNKLEEGSLLTEALGDNGIAEGLCCRDPEQLLGILLAHRLW